MPTPAPVNHHQPRRGKYCLRRGDVSAAANPDGTATSTSMMFYWAQLLFLEHCEIHQRESLSPLQWLSKRHFRSEADPRKVTVIITRRLLLDTRCRSRPRRYQPGGLRTFLQSLCSTHSRIRALIYDANAIGITTRQSLRARREEGAWAQNRRKDGLSRVWQA